MKAAVRGPFRVWDNKDVDRTPKGIKARALLALLLLSPRQRRTRAWLQDKLWSDRAPEQASVSFRQALAHVRRDLGPLSDRLKSDRTALWLDPLVPLDLEGGDAGAELLNDLDVRDPEFVDWLRDLRQQHAGDDAPEAARDAAHQFLTTPLLPQPRPAVAIICSKPAQTDRGRFLAMTLAGRIAADLMLSGQMLVTLNDGSDGGAQGAAPQEPAQVTIEIETLGEADMWYVAIRTLGQPYNRCIWTGRLQLPMDMAKIWDSPETLRLINKAVNSVVDSAILSRAQTPFVAIQRAIRRIFDMDRAGLKAADDLLREAQSEEGTAVALAWRSFARLVSVLEFREPSEALLEEAVEFSNDALKKLRAHPTILGLSSRIQMELIGDSDYGYHLACLAMEADDQSPYALDAFSQAHFIRGAFDQGHQIAERARLASSGLPHSYQWDLLCCFSSLGLGRYEEALAHALACHRKMPTYRPALRYLIALHLLAGRISEAKHYENRLRLLEPDFTLKHFLQPAYPIETFRKFGLKESISQLIV